MRFRHMRRWVFVVALVAALALPAAALAVRYLGPLNGGENNAGIEIDFKRDGNTPKKVTLVEWHNLTQVIQACGPTLSYAKFFETMRVKDGVFHGSGNPGEAGNPDDPPDNRITETIRGKFKHHNKKIVGTLRIQADHGCSGLDTGKLPFVAR